MRSGPPALTAGSVRVQGFDRPLARSFYERESPRVARELLGSFLVHRTSGGDLAARIVETEAYGPSDPASHAFLGPTLRNRSMFGPPGTLYVYRIHQVHCANAVTRPGEAVLLRAASPLSPGLPNASGPGRLCRSMQLDRGNDGDDLVTGTVRLLGGPVDVGPVIEGPRVGIRVATSRRLRFALRDDLAVSRPTPWRRAQRSLAQL